MKGNLRLLRALVVVLVAVALNVVFPASSFADGYPPGQSPAYMTGMYSQGAAGYPSPFAYGYAPGQSPAYMTGMYSRGAAGYPSSCIRSIYFVRLGDNLFRIGLRFGVSPLRLALFNGLRNPNLVFAGMRLAIPCSRVSAPGYSPYSMPSYSPYSMSGRSPYMMPGYMSNPMSGYPPAPPSPPTTGQGMVVMRNIAFTPATITIHVGQQVMWRNDDSAPHTTTSGSCSGNVCTPMPGWDSGTLSRGQSFSHTFNTAGTFTYYCRIHGAMMQGSVVVMP